MTRNVVSAGRAVGDGIASVTGSSVPEQREKIDAPDPGATPYPNLGTFPTRPPRGGQEARAAEMRTLEQQRDAALDYDAKLRAIDPSLDPGARPPEPPAIAAALEKPAPATSSPAAATVAPVPVVVPPAVAPAAVPVPQTAVPLLRPNVSPVPVVVPPPVAPVAAPPPQIAAAPSTRAVPTTGAIVGDVDFLEGTVQLTPHAKSDLRAAVIAAQARNGRVRVTPASNVSLSPVDQSLTSRRMAAIAIELEELGLDRSRIIVDQGWLRAGRISVEY